MFRNANQWSNAIEKYKHDINSLSQAAIETDSVEAAAKAAGNFKEYRY